MTKKIKLNKSLSLNKESIVKLQESQLAAVHGGKDITLPSVVTTGVPTISCIAFTCNVSCDAHTCN